MTSYEFYLLDKSFDRQSFDCGSVELNNFLKTKARQNQSVGFNKTFVAVVDGDKTKKVLGYYSISMGEIKPKHPVPVARMGRLAVDASTKGQGLGKLLLVDAIRRVQAASQLIGVYALLVDAKDDLAKNFYLKYGFIPLSDDPMILFLPLTY